MSGTCFFSMTFDMCACSAELSCEKSMFFFWAVYCSRKNISKIVARDGHSSVRVLLE